MIEYHADDVFEIFEGPELKTAVESLKNKGMYYRPSLIAKIWRRRRPDEIADLIEWQKTNTLKKDLLTNK